VIRATLLLLVSLAGAVPRAGFRVPRGDCAGARACAPSGPTRNVERGTRNESAHDLHVSLTRLVLEGKTLACRIRLFRDDLQLALRQHANRPELRLTEAARADSLVAAYLGTGLRLDVDGRRVTLRVTGSGAERDQAAQEVMWYVLEAELAAPATRLTILNGVMFEQFRDQQNIVQLLRLPGDRRRTLYFTASDPREQTISF